jgi:hypothetical protein
MPAIWENPFANAHLKVERANKHIADIEQRLRASSDTYGPMMHIDMKTGEKFLDYILTDRTLRPDLALIVGDAVHNLQCALDIAWCAAVRLLHPRASSKYLKFPIYKTRHQLKSTLTESRKIPPSSVLFDLVVNRVKCYEGGDTDLLALHHLDIDDKHHLLIPMLAVTGVEGVEVEHEDGTVNRYEIMLVPPNSYRTTVPLNSKIKNHGEVRFEVTFGKGTPLEGIEVIPTLKRFSWKTSRIVRVLQRTARGIL